MKKLKFAIRRLFCGNPRSKPGSGITAKTEIIARLSSGEFLAVHEMNISRYSENNIATRCSELAKDGVIFGRYRKGARFKEWGLTAGQ